jgi:hypothetical protein
LATTADASRSSKPIFSKKLATPRNAYHNYNHVNINPIHSLVPLSFKTLFYVPIIMGTVKIEALVDSGAFSSAISLSEFNRIRAQKTENPVTRVEKVKNEVVRVANGTPARIMFRADIKIQFACRSINEKFVVIDKLNSAILGIPFFKNNNILIDLAKKRLQCPDFTLQINQIVQKDGTQKKVFPKNTFPVATVSKQVIEPNEQVVIFCKIDASKEKGINLSGVIEPSIPFEKRTELCVTSSLSKSDERGYFPVGILNLSPVSLHHSSKYSSWKAQVPNSAAGSVFNTY